MTRSELEVLLLCAAWLAADGHRLPVIAAGEALGYTWTQADGADQAVNALAISRGRRKLKTVVTILDAAEHVEARREPAGEWAVSWRHGVRQALTGRMPWQ